MAILIGSLLFLYWVTLPVVIGALAETRGYAEDRLGLLASLYSAGIFLTTVSSMFWIHRVDWVILVKVGSLLTAIGFALLFINSSFTVLALGHVVASLGLGVAYAVVMATLGEQEQPARGYALVFFLQVALGVSVSALMTMALSYAQIVSFSAALMIMVGSVCVALAHRLPSGSRKVAGQDEGHLGISGRWGMALPPVPVLLGLLAILLVFTGDAGVWIFLERIGNARFGQEVGGLLVSVNLGAGACGSLSAAWVSERFGYLWPMVIAIVLSIVSVAMMAMENGVPMLMAASFVNGWSWNFGAAYRMGLVSKLDTTGRFTVLIPAMQTLGNSLGPLMVGYLIVQGGYSLAFLVTALLWIWAFGVYYPAWRRYREMNHGTYNAA